MKTIEKLKLIPIVLGEESVVANLPLDKISGHLVKIYVKLLDSTDFNTLQTFYGVLTGEISSKSLIFEQKIIL